MTIIHNYCDIRRWILNWS